MTAALDALTALKAHLETITVGNGYATDIGMVAVGRAALAVGSKAPLPAVTLTTTRDDPTTGGAVQSGNWHQAWTRTVELEALVSGADGWETALDAMIDDIRKALSRFPRPLNLSGISFIPPADGGAIAAAVMQLTFDYTADYSE